MPGDIAVRAFDKTVERHQVPHDQFCHRVLNHLCFATGCSVGQPVQYCKRFFRGIFAARLDTADVGTSPMTENPRSGCAINLTLEVIGDKWSLLVIRDMIFGNRRHFRELLTNSQEGISSNILADRLKTLLDPGIITWADDPT